MSSWETTSFKSENRVRLNEIIRIVDYRNVKKFKEYRFIGGLYKYAQIWMPIFKDGKPMAKKTGDGILTIPFNVTNFDPKTETFDETKKCPFVEAAEKMAKYMDEEQAKNLSVNVGFMAQAINRDLQENPDKKGKPSKTERKTGFKESIDSESFTPVEVHMINYTIGQHLESIKETNTIKLKATGEKVEKTVADKKYGRDVKIKYDSGEKGQAKYKVMPGERTPLTEEEEAYLLWDVVSGLVQTTLSTKEAKIEADRLLKEFMKSVKKKKSSDDDDEDEDLPEDVEEKVSKKKSSKKKIDDEDDEDEDVDLDESPSPAKKPKKKPSKKKDEDEDDSDPLLSPSPAAKKPKKKPSKKKDDDEEGESPSPVKTSKKKPAAKKKDEDEDDEDSEDDDLDLSDDEDEDEDGDEDEE